MAGADDGSALAVVGDRRAGTLVAVRHVRGRGPQPPQVLSLAGRHIDSNPDLAVAASGHVALALTAPPSGVPYGPGTGAASGTLARGLNPAVLLSSGAGGVAATDGRLAAFAALGPKGLVALTARAGAPLDAARAVPLLRARDARTVDVTVAAGRAGFAYARERPGRDPVEIRSGTLRGLGPAFRIAGLTRSDAYLEDLDVTRAGTPVVLVRGQTATRPPSELLAARLRRRDGRPERAQLVHRGSFDMAQLWPVGQRGMLATYRAGGHRVTTHQTR